MISWTELHTFIFVVLIKLCVISMRRCVCVCALRIVSTDKILHILNTLIDYYYFSFGDFDLMCQRIILNYAICPEVTPCSE